MKMLCYYKDLQQIVISVLVFCLHKKVFTLGLLQIHIAFVASKAVVDQQTSESQVSSSQVAQQRLFDKGYDYHEPVIVDDPHHHHEEHDPGFWKKKVTWKEGWKKYWVSEGLLYIERNCNDLFLQKPGKKQIWKPDIKKIWKPVWVPIQVPVWKDIQV